MKSNSPAPDSCFQRLLRRRRDIPQHATDFYKVFPWRAPTYFRPDFASNHTLLPIVALPQILQPQSYRIDDGMFRASAGLTRPQRFTGEYHCGRSIKFRWPDGAGKPGYRVDHLPCSGSAGRPAPAAPTGAACWAVRPILRTGRAAEDGFPAG